MHACLSLGFEGVYRAAGGPGALQAIRRDLYETIRRAQPKTIEDLSPHWRGQTIALAGSRFQVPVWAVAAAAGVILLGAYLVPAQCSERAGRGARAQDGADPSGHRDHNCPRDRGQAAARPGPRSLDPAPAHPRRARQGNSRRQGRRGPVGDNDIHSHRQRRAVSLGRRDGQPCLRANRGKKIAAALDKEPGAIHVDGYTDTDPITTVAFPSNFELSQARAKSVAAMLKPGISHPDRLTVSGQGRGQPGRPERHRSRTNRRTVASKCPFRAPTDGSEREISLSRRDRRLSMTMIAWLWIALSVLGALVLAALVWLAGPLDLHRRCAALRRRPDPRSVIIALIFLIVAGVDRLAGHRPAARRRQDRAGDDRAGAGGERRAGPERKDGGCARDAQALRQVERPRPLRSALVSHHRAAGRRQDDGADQFRPQVSARRRQCGQGGAGGRRNALLRLVVHRPAVLIDTAGRYTTQDSDAKVDRKSWLAFLEMLRKNRPRQPINGVIVAISIADVLNLPPAEVAAHADAIRKRLDELHEELKVDFPVYAVFTKMDLVAGFSEYFADLDEEKRKVVWGATFQTADKKANNVGKVPEEMDLLIQRISERMTERLQEEPDLRSRAILFGFPAQLGAIRKPIAEFLNRIFEPTRYQTTATLRGFYFTSGTQEGTPFDALIGALQKSYGVESSAPPASLAPARAISCTT